MADNEVLISLKLVQKGDSIQIVQKRTKKLGDETQKLDRKRQKLSKTTDAYNRREKGAAGISSNSTKNFSKMAQGIDGGGGSGGLVRAYALLAANVFALSAAFGILSRSAQIDTLVESMTQLEVVSGKSIRSVARDLQEASGFGMDFAESMRATALATSAGFNGSQIAELGEVARNAAVSLGRNLPDALDRIFRGVIKVEPELLDEIGLFVRVNDASKKYAAGLKKGIGDLTEFEKRQAFLTEALRQGTDKFEAFSEIDNDAFALIATTFSDMTQGILSFINKGLTPVISMLANSKVLFGTVFAVIAFTLTRMAVPAMAAFTNSIATNAATSAAAASEELKNSKIKSQLSNAQHKRYMKDALQKLSTNAKILQAETQAGPQGKLKVRGGKSKELEKALKKELGTNARIHVVKQRILDITKKQGLESRMKNPIIQQELALLRQEEAVHAKITVLKQQQAGAGSFEAIKTGSVAAMTSLNAMKTSLIANGLAMVANTAQTQGLRAAFDQINIELQETVVKAGLAGISLTFLDKVMFKTKAGAIALGIAAQGMWMKIMGPFSIFLMFLPILMKFNKMLGAGSEQAEKLTKANKAAAEALEVLPARMERVNKVIDKGTESYAKQNSAILAFKDTIASTVQSLSDQQKAFEEYTEKASGWAKFWGEAVPKFFGGGTENKIKRLRKDLVANLRGSSAEISSSMQALFDKMDADEAARNKRKGGNKGWKNSPEEEQQIKDTTAAILARAKVEADSFAKVSSAIKGATDSAQQFTNSFLISTKADAPLSTFRQITESLKDAALTEEDRVRFAKEISENAAIRALMTQEEADNLKASTEDTEKYAGLLEIIERRYLAQQESIIRIKSELKFIAVLQKNIAKAADASASAIEVRFNLEKNIARLNKQKVKDEFLNRQTATGLTEEKIKELAQHESLVEFYEAEALKAEDIKLVQAAINAFREKENFLLQEAVDSATRSYRIQLDKKKLLLESLKVEEAINTVATARALITARIAAFEKTGSSTLTNEEAMRIMIAGEKTRLLTATRKANIEKSILNLQGTIIQEELKVLKEKALERLNAKRAVGPIQGGSDEEIRFDNLTAAIGESTQLIGQQTQLIDDELGLAAENFGLSLQDAFESAVKGSTVGEDLFGKGSQSDVFDTFTTFANAKNEAGDAINTEAQVFAAGIQLMENQLLSFADTIDATLGEEGKLISSLARVGAATLDMSVQFNDAMFDAADNTKEKVAAIATLIAGMIGQVMSMLSAQTEQTTALYDREIAAEKNRDGKSKQSVAKMAELEKKKDNMKKKAFQLNKKLMIAQAIASTAAGVAGALNISTPYEFPFAATIATMIGALGLAQVAMISGLTYQSATPPAATNIPTNISVGKRDNRVDTSKGASSGELSYLRGGSGVGSNANDFKPGGAAGMKKGYASGGEILVGERGPEIVQPTSEGYNVIPNDKLGGGPSNVNFTINAVDAEGVQNVLQRQRGNIIGMIREAANEHGETFMEQVNVEAY